MSNHLNLNPHIILTKPRHPDTCPNRQVIGHIPLEVAHHRIKCFIVEGKVIRVHSEHLLPALPTCMLQAHLDIGKRLVDLCVDLAVDDTRRRVPASYCDIINGCSLGLMNSFRLR